MPRRRPSQDKTPVDPAFLVRAGEVPRRRVLCLHGFGEDAESMSFRVAPLAAAMRDECDFVVPPHSDPWWRASSTRVRVCAARAHAHARAPTDASACAGLLSPSYGGCQDTFAWLADFDQPVVD